MSQLNLTLMLSSPTDWSTNGQGAMTKQNKYYHHPSQSGSGSEPTSTGSDNRAAYYGQLMELLQRYSDSRNSTNTSNHFNLTQRESLIHELLGGYSNSSSGNSHTSYATQLGLQLLTGSSPDDGASSEIEEIDTTSGDVLPSVRIALCIVYACICLLGVAGNGLVFFSVARNPAMHSVTNVFISNLAFSDILLSLFAVPITPLYLLVFKAWHFGAVLCHLLPFAQGASIYISAFTLMSIAIDRYQVIMYPLRARMKVRGSLRKNKQEVKIKKLK